MTTGTRYSMTLPSFSFTELEQESALSSLAQACQSWGFFRLTDHRIPSTIENHMLQRAGSFFSLPREQKVSYQRSEDNPWGYFDQELTKNRADWKEIFDLGHDQTHQQYQSKTPWPSSPEDFQSAMLDWYDQCENLGLFLLERIILSLETENSVNDAAQVRACFEPKNSSFLRLNHYPVCDTPAPAIDDFPEVGHLGIHHHTDAGALTVLLQDNVSGLQVRKNDQWHTVAPEPGSLIINVGDLVQVWSNDLYQAPVHRVLANADDERFSAAFFLNPDFDTECRPLVNQAARYTPVNWGEFRAARASGDYANQGTETQITDYRR